MRCAARRLRAAGRTFLAFLAAAVGLGAALTALRDLPACRDAQRIGTQVLVGSSLINRVTNAGAAVLACAIPFFYADLDHVPLILAAIFGGGGG